jgi:hypothetical protein
LTLNEEIHHTSAEALATIPVKPHDRRGEQSIEQLPASVGQPIGGGRGVRVLEGHLRKLRLIA